MAIKKTLLVVLFVAFLLASASLQDDAKNITSAEKGKLKVEQHQLQSLTTELCPQKSGNENGMHHCFGGDKPDENTSQKGIGF